VTAAGILTTLSSLGLYGLLTVSLGRSALRLWRASLPRSAPAASVLEGWAPAFLSGQLVLAVALLVTGFLPLSLRGAGLLLVTLALLPLAVAGLQGRPGRKRSGKPRLEELRWTSLTTGALALLYPNVLFWIFCRPVVDWDARSIWFFHARVLWIDHGLDPSLFTDPLYLHSAYPLLLPAQGAWLALIHHTLFGVGWSDVVAKSFLLLDFAAYFHLLWSLLRIRGFPVWLGGVATVVFLDLGLRTGVGGFGYAYVNGYADAHYIAPFLLALLAFSLPAGRGGPALGVLLLAFGANVKLESGLYALLLALGAAAVAVAHGLLRRLGEDPTAGRGAGHDGQDPDPTSPRTRPRALVLGGLMLGGLPLGLWALFRTIHGIGSTMDPLRWLRDVPGALARVGDRGGEVSVFLAGHLLGRGALWLLLLWVGLMAVRLRRGSRLQRAEWVGGTVVGSLLPLILGIYALTPLELDVHLRTSADRLLSLPLALLYGLVLLALAPLLSLEGSPLLRSSPPASAPRS